MTEVPTPDRRLLVAFSDLDDDEPEYDYPPPYARYQGKPFSGTAFEREGDCETRCDYESGRRHGSYRTITDTGQVLSLASYVEGQPSGEHRSYFRDGTLRELELYDPPGKLELSRTYDATGRLRHERTAEGYRTWYGDGALRSESRDGVSKTYTRDGRCAYERHPRPSDQTTVHGNFVFHEHVLADAALELVEDFSFEYDVWMWMHRRLDAGDASAHDDLRRFLGHQKLAVRATAMQIVGNRGIQALVPELRALLADERVPPSEHGEYPGQGGRGHSFSLAKTARLMLDKLGA